jgi:predicted permease
MNDLRYALRQLLKNPGFTAIALLTLALGIAGNVVIFTIFNALFLRPLPFKNGERLVNLDEVAPKWNLEYTGVALEDLVNWREQNQTFESIGAWEDTSFNLSLKSEAQRVDAGRATYDLLDTLGIVPVCGRKFTSEEDKPRKGQVALLGYALWKRSWAGDPNVLGQTVSLDNVPHTIIGVLPSEIGPLSRAQVIVPLARIPNEGHGWYLEAAGRLKPGITVDRAREDLTRIHKTQVSTRPVNEITSPRVTPLRERLLGDYRPVTYVLIAAVGVVWLISCANVAGLVLARGLARGKEISVRMALGASRHRVVRQVLVESLLLSALGGLIGMLLGQASLTALLRVLPNHFPAWIHFGMDWRFVLFCLSTTALTAVLFGLMPAVKMVSRVNLQGALQASGSRTSGSTNQRRSLNFLVTGEIGLALVLLINAGLLIEAFRGLQRIDPGFRPENVLTYNLALPRIKYTNNQHVAFFEEHLAQLRALPGVKAASATTIVPLGGHTGTFFQIEGAAPRLKDEQEPVVLMRKAFPDYDETIGLTVLSGRFFSQAETRSNAVNAIVINESFAKRNWPKQDALGKRVRLGPESPWLVVIGVVKDIKHYGFDQPMRPGVYLPYHYAPERSMTIVARTLMDPKALLPSIRALIQKTDPDLPIFEIKTMAERVSDSLWLRKSYSWLFGFFAAVALTMALGGIYGVISYAVSQRTNEIGIRMALGAQRGDVLRLILRHGLLLAGAGTVIGFVGALAMTQVMRSLLVGINPSAPLIFVSVPLLLTSVVGLACYLPARRATKVNPMVALRYE